MTWLKATRDLKVSLNGYAGVMRSDGYHTDAEFVREELQEIQRSALLARGAAQKVVHFVNDDDRRPEQAKQTQRPLLEHVRSLIRQAGCSDSAHQALSA